MGTGIDKIRIGFLGYGTRALDYLMGHPLFDVRYFFVPRDRLCRDVYDAQERYHADLNMEIIDDNEQLAARFSQISDADCFLMNACPIILNHDVLSRMKVFNIHPGDLRYNRGHHPHCWTVLLGERQTKIVLHRVNEKIDAGSVVKSVDIAVSEDDSAGDVLNHAEDKIPILLDALYAHLKEHTAYEAVVENGGYRRMMAYEDYEIHLQMDSAGQIKRKILSRSMHHGAFFWHGPERIYVDRILFYEESGRKQEGTVTVWVDKQRGTVSIHSAWREIVFRLNEEKMAGLDGGL